MRRNKGLFKKILVYGLIGSTLAGNIMPAMAYDYLDQVQYNGKNSIAEVHATQEITEDASAEVQVYAELGSEFKVTIPKALTLSGTDKNGKYTVDVEGDIGGTDVIKVVPEESFLLSSTGLADVTATVSQDKTQWSYSEILPDSKTIGNGTINASGITAGTWEGSFWFNVSLEEGTGTGGSDETQSVLTLSESDVIMGAEDSVQVNAYLNGEEVNESVTWSSDNENITVTNGLVETKASAEVGDTATVTVTANSTENLSAMANVLSDLGIVTFASADDDLSATFTVTIIDMAYTTSGEDEVITSLDLKAGESKDVEVTIIPASATGIVKWSTTAPAGINLVKNGNTVTIKIADDMETGKSYDLVATYGNFSKLLTINIAGEEEHIHDYTETVTKEATCTEAGEKKFTCDCGESYTTEIPATGHNYENGSCTDCGEEETHEHDYTETVTKEATCTEAGEKKFTCDCGESYTTEIPKTEHTFENGSCTECGTEDPDHEHDYTETVTKEATCTEEGEKKFTCDCGESYITEIPATDHTFENGSCTDCGETDPDYVALEAGLYNANGVMLCSWENSGIDIEIDYGTSTSTNPSYETTKTSLYYVLTNRYPTTTKVVIPKGITRLGNFAFYNCTGVTSVEIPDGVTSIGVNAFYGCTNLTSVEIPDSVTSIENQAFNNCKGLTSITIPDSVRTIGRYAFSNCTNLTSVEISDAVTSIEEFTFSGCTNLTSIEIPNSVTSIGRGAFNNCTSLTSIGGVGSGASIEIPNSVTSIGSSGFSNCTSLASVEIPNGVISIGSTAFCNCTNLTSITIPESVSSIEDGAFHSSKKLSTIEVDGNNGSYCSVDNIIFSKNMDAIVFYPASKTSSSYIIPDSVTTIRGYAFYSCTSLTSITIPDGVTSIGYYAFRDCVGLTSIEIPDSVTSIEDVAFNNCRNLTSITIGNGVTSIGKQAFINCPKLTSATFKKTSGWYVGDSENAKTTAISSSNLANKSTAATYLISTYYNKYWTR